ncbi:MAG: hypothetical protein ABWK00_03000, partial [Desulfurococcaceae archaeon]
MDPEEVEAYYRRGYVSEAIASFSRGRWVALEGAIGGDRVFVRYWGAKPLTIADPRDVARLVHVHRGLGIRTFYATMHVYRSLEGPDSVDDPANVIASTPFWDIDVSGPEHWRAAIEAAIAIRDLLEGEGVEESLHVIWTGSGAHVRLCEGSLPPAELGASPIDAAFAVVEYVLRRARDRLEEIARRAPESSLKVENLVDPKRVFTAPLSLHRRHDLAAIAVGPDELESFDISWASPANPRASDAWRRCEEGEALELARRALREVGGRTRRSAAVAAPAARAQAGQATEIPRFQVMALLQAARYYALAGDIEKAKSFGLNRAIFYAYLKHYGRGAGRTRKGEPLAGGHGNIGAGLARAWPLRDEAELSSDGLFMIGGREQRPEDFDREVARRVDGIIPFEIAWEAALKYVSKFPREVLEDPQKFYELVYEPVRDSFARKVVLRAFEEGGVGAAPSRAERRRP